MVRRGIRCIQLVTSVSITGAIDRADDYAVLKDEDEQELAHLGSLEETF